MTTPALANRVVTAAKDKGLWLTTAESLTGGMICSTLVSVPGASKVVAGGICSYDPRIKHELLQVETQVIDTVGVVSSPCACQMAKGARALMKVDCAVSATGLAGPGGGTPQAPVGTVFLGISTQRGTKAIEYHFRGGRARIRRQATKAALKLLLAAITQ